MAGMNPGFAAYLAKKKAGGANAAPVATGKKPDIRKPGDKIDPKMKLNAKHTAIQQRAQAY